MDGDVPFLIVVGCRRSGTTLLRSIFDSHPDMAMPYEAHFVAPMGGRRCRYERPDGFHVGAFLADLYRDRNVRRLELPQDELRRALTETRVVDVADAIRRVFRTYAAMHGASRYGDKTPGYVLRLPLLAELFPEARFVHIVRDGRDVTSSLLELWFADKGAGQAALFWKRRVSAGRQAGRRLGPERYREVRYEDLIDDPRSTVASLCAFAELEFDEEMLHYFERADVVAGTGFAHIHRHQSLPPTKGLRDWRKDLDAETLRLVDTLAGDLLQDLGYEVSSPRSPARVRLAAGRETLRWQATRASFHLPRLARRTMAGL